MSVIQKITLQDALKNELFLNYCITVHLQIPYFSFFCKWAKNAVNINFFFNKGHIWRQHYQISFKKLSNLCKKLLDTFLCFCRSKHKSHSASWTFLVTFIWPIWQLPNYEKLESQKRPTLENIPHQDDKGDLFNFMCIVYTPESVVGFLNAFITFCNVYNVFSVVNPLRAPLFIIKNY